MKYKMQGNTGCKDERWVEETIIIALHNLTTIGGRNLGLSMEWRQRTSAVLIGVGKQLSAVGYAIKKKEQ